MKLIVVHLSDNSSRPAAYANNDFDTQAWLGERRQQMQLLNVVRVEERILEDPPDD